MKYEKRSTVSHKLDIVQPGEKNWYDETRYEKLLEVGFHFEILPLGGVAKKTNTIMDGYNRQTVLDTLFLPLEIINRWSFNFYLKIFFPFTDI